MQLATAAFLVFVTFYVSIVKDGVESYSIANLLFEIIVILYMMPEIFGVYLLDIMILLSTYFAGRFEKLDSITAPPKESHGFLRSVYNFFTGKHPNTVALSDIKEFELCLQAYLPQLTFTSIPMGIYIESAQNRVAHLYEMTFMLSDYREIKRFLALTNEDKLKVEHLSGFL